MGNGVRKVILRKEVDTVAIEGAFNCGVDGSTSVNTVNRVQPVSVGIHYPSKSLWSDI